MSKPAIKTELWSPKSAAVCIKEEVADPANIRTCNCTIKEEDMGDTVDRLSQQPDVQYMKQENSSICVEIQQKWNLPTKSLSEKPFPVALYRVNATSAMDPPEISFSTLHNGDRQLHADVPLPASELKQSDCVDPTNTCSVNNLERPARTHTGDKPYKCSLCPYSCAHRSTLDFHVMTHTGDKPHKCSLCPYSSARKSNLKTHMVTHTFIKPCKCSLCSYSSGRKSDLKKHVMMHTDDKPYKCSLCAYSSARASTLKVHTRTHTGDKPYKCSLCPYSSAKKCNLKTHMTTHTGDKPYKCSTCRYSCALQSRLNRHMKIHIDEKP